jgi:diaminohydroxyphosphoribosylaminopyrimidine deaminase / 5-amino-6-(5-phosphoribosylamino)uracil reductase
MRDLPIGDQRRVDELLGRSEWAAVNAHGRPFVVYKIASTLDGRIAAADGTSRWITSPQSRAEVQLLRAWCDATVVGSGTQRADNPSLAVRGSDDPRLEPAKLALARVQQEGQPFRVVVDSNARTSPDAKVLDDAAPTIIAVAPDAEAAHLESCAGLIRVPRSARGLDVDALLEGLYEYGVRAVFLEGGPTLAGSFIARQRVDRIISYLAPALLGSGRSGLMDAGIATIDDIIRLELLDVGRSGPDLRLVARPQQS